MRRWNRGTKRCDRTSAAEATSDQPVPDPGPSVAQQAQPPAALSALSTIAPAASQHAPAAVGADHRERSPPTARGGAPARPGAHPMHAIPRSAPRWLSAARRSGPAAPRPSRRSAPSGTRRRSVPRRPAARRAGAGRSAGAGARRRLRRTRGSRCLAAPAAATSPSARRTGRCRSRRRHGSRAGRSSRRADDGERRASSTRSRRPSPARFAPVNSAASDSSTVSPSADHRSRTRVPAPSIGLEVRDRRDRAETGNGHAPADVLVRLPVDDFLDRRQAARHAARRGADAVRHARRGAAPAIVDRDRALPDARSAGDVSAAHASAGAAATRSSTSSSTGSPSDRAGAARSRPASARRGRRPMSTTSPRCSTASTDRGPCPIPPDRWPRAVAAASVTSTKPDGNVAAAVVPLSSRCTRITSGPAISSRPAMRVRTNAP